jgi:hypothetical protein
LSGRIKCCFLSPTSQEDSTKQKFFSLELASDEKESRKLILQRWLLQAVIQTLPKSVPSELHPLAKVRLALLRPAHEHFGRRPVPQSLVHHHASGFFGACSATKLSPNLSLRNIHETRWMGLPRWQLGTPDLLLCLSRRSWDACLGRLGPDCTARESLHTDYVR